MTNHRNNGGLLSRFAPGGGRNAIALVVVAVVAFLLGGILFGDGQHADRHTDADDATRSASAAPAVWTCSMHPQIQLQKAGKCPICYMDLIPLEAGPGSDLGPRQLRLSETASKLARIQTTRAVRGFAEAEVRMVGKIAYDETNVAYITARVPGRLDRLYADYTGIAVNKGDHLIELYSPELLAAQEELMQARAAVDALSNASSSVLQSTARATLDAARDKLRLWGLTKTQIEKIESTREVSDHLTIYSPIGGVVVHKNAKEGMYVETGSRVYTIADLDKLWVIFEAYESDLPWLRFGQWVEFTSPSFPGERFEAVISFIDPLVDPGTRTVKVRAVVENENRKLKPDMFVRGVVKSRIDGEGHIIDEYLADKWISPMHPEIIKDHPGTCDVCGMDLVPATSLGFVGTQIDDHEAPLLIPASAPLITGKRAVVYVEISDDEGPLFEGREVDLGPRAGDAYVVRSGIEEGEMVVSNGAFKIDSELQLQAKPSMMSPAGAGRGVHAHDAAMPEDDASADSDAPKRVAVARALGPVYDAYFDVQMALAKDDLDAARTSGERLVAAIDAVDISVFTRSEHARWMELARTLSKHAAALAGTKDIATARDAFFFLSETTIDAHDRFGHAGEAIFYLTHCPMAKQGKGAYWLQTEDVVWNSYYGASMLRCGSIEKTLAATTDGTGVE